MDESEWLASDDPRAMLDAARRRFRLGEGVTYGEQLGGAFRVLSDRKLRLFACGVCRQVWHLLTDERSRRAVEVAERLADGEVTVEELKAARNACRTLRAADVAGRWACLTDAQEAAHHCLLRTRRTGTRAENGAAQAALLRDICGNPFRPVRLPSVCLLCGCDRFEPEVEYAACARCGRDMGCPWRTPTVAALARAAYEQRPGRKCSSCQGDGGQQRYLGYGEVESESCPDCGGTGRIEDGTLDPIRLAILADALEEAGCAEASLLQHLRGWEVCPECEGHVVVPPLRCPCQTGWILLRGPHVRGCHVLDALLGRS